MLKLLSVWLRTECFCLPKIHILKLQYDGIWRRGFWEVVKFEEGGAFMMGLVSLKEYKSLSLSPHTQRKSHVRIYQKGDCLPVSQKRALART